jgi:hypothetical protein
MIVNEILPFGMEELISLFESLLSSRVDIGFTDVKLGTALVSLHKGILNDLQIDPFFKIIPEERHSEVLMYCFSIEFRQGFILIVKKRTLLCFSEILAKLRFDLIDGSLSRGTWGLMSKRI